MRPGLIVRNLSRSGDLDAVRQYVEVTIPSLSKEDQLEYCAHYDKPCPRMPCIVNLSYLAQDAVLEDQLKIFEYLWDTFLGPGGYKLTWQMLERTAREGRLNFAESFWARDPNCFQTLSPDQPRGPPEGESQITHAVASSNFEYASYMLEHGADINNSSPQWKIVPTTVSWRASPENASLRIQYLVDHGAHVDGTGALLKAVTNCHAFVRPLLSSGVDPNEVVEDAWKPDEPARAPLIEAAARGNLDVVRTLIAHGADINLIDGSGLSALDAAEEHNQVEVTNFLQSLYLHFVMWISHNTRGNPQ